MPYEAEKDEKKDNIFHWMCKDSYQCSQSLLEDTIYLFLSDYRARYSGSDRLYMVPYYHSRMFSLRTHLLTKAKNACDMTALDVLISSNVSDIDRCMPILLLFLSDHDFFNNSSNSPWQRIQQVLYFHSYSFTHLLIYLLIYLFIYLLIYLLTLLGLRYGKKGQR